MGWLKMFEWSWIVSPATMLSLGIALVAVVDRLRKNGGRERDIDIMRDDLASLKSTRAAERDADRKEREMFQAAINAGLAATRADMSDFQKLCAERFATKTDLRDCEERANKNQDRIINQLDQIGDRLTKIGDKIMGG